LKNYELESFIKSFLLFFFSLTLLVVVLFYFDYKKNIENLKNEIFTQMRMCSFDLKCPDFDLKFEKKESIKPLFLYEDKGGLVSYFNFLGINEKYLSIRYSKQKYKMKKEKYLKNIILKYIFIEFILMLLSFLFSYYALRPLRDALLTIEEFIKDILHDVNTPITTLALNSALLKDDDKNMDKIKKINHSIKKIVWIQDNLKSYISDMPTQKDIIRLRPIVLDQIKFFSSIYTDISYQIVGDSFKVYTNKELLSRILSNIISNAYKYNKRGGTVIISCDSKHSKLIIKDSGIGIKNPSKVFDRFYKEQSRGTGIGLHIVKKFCDELMIGVELKSKLSEGTEIILDFSKIKI